VKPTHADFRPGKRPRYVPSGAPRRKIPVLRIALLIALGLLVYTRFDDYWPRLRDTVNPVSLWRQAFGQPEVAATDAVFPVWSRDSSRVMWKCTQGLAGACCASLRSVHPDLCGEASALLAKARWKHLVDAPSVTGKNRLTLQLEARAVVSDLGDWSFELSGLQGRDPAGNYLLRRAAGSSAWCDAGRGCLRDLLPRAPLPQGRLQDGADAAGLWTASGGQVGAILPGRVVALDSVPRNGGEGGGMRVEVYHGRELYAFYGPLTPAPGVRAGALVKAGSHLGSAPVLGDGESGHALLVQVRQAGQNLDPAAFWGVRPAPVPETPPNDDPLYSEVR
jgi:hypothetical protein